jgi:hypothetical protein
MAPYAWCKATALRDPLAADWARFDAFLAEVARDGG